MHIDIDYRTADLEAVLAHCWLMLETGAKRSKAPFHTPVIGTVNAVGCSLRSVVLRRVIVSKRLLLCHTDRRSNKVTEIKKHNRLSWLFYDPDKKIQLRAEGPSTLHHDDVLAHEQWSQTRLMSRRCYCSKSAPGTIQPSRSSGLPKKYGTRSPLTGQCQVLRLKKSLISETDTVLDAALSP